MTPAPFRIHPLAPSGVDELVPLLRAYMQETYSDRWHGTAAALGTDLRDRCAIEVAVSAADDLVAFLAWAPSYDLHHCVSGADVLDLYVVPPWRGRGVAVALMCAVAARVSKAGGVYLKGTAVAGGTGRRLYDRIAVCTATQDCIVGGRAFRRLASLAGEPVRAMIAGLPAADWNYEG